MPARRPEEKAGCPWRDGRSFTLCSSHNCRQRLAAFPRCVLPHGATTAQSAHRIHRLAKWTLVIRRVNARREVSVTGFMYRPVAVISANTVFMFRRVEVISSKTVFMYRQEEVISSETVFMSRRVEVISVNTA